MVEVLIVMIILGVVTSAFLASLASMQKGIFQAENRSRRNDEIRLALAQLDREIRSGNVFHDPAQPEQVDLDVGIVASMGLRIYTQTNAPTRDEECAQWRIADGQLQTRLWARGETTPKPWRIVATDIVNRDLDPPVPAFVLDDDPALGGRILHITMVADRTDDAAKPEEMRLSITGRNTHNAQYNQGACDTVPPVA